MAGVAADGGVQPGPAAKNLGRRRAAGIYGAIITAAILDTAGGHLSTAALVISVVVTLLVYWLAEEYAEVLGEQAAGGRLPSRAYIREALTATWPMVSASYAPLLALVLARLAGASALTAANIGLAAAIVLLTIHGWLAGRAAQLRGRQLLATTSVAAALGLVMILLKDSGPDPPALMSAADEPQVTRQQSSRRPPLGALPRLIVGQPRSPQADAMPGEVQHPRATPGTRLTSEGPLVQAQLRPPS